MVIRNESPYLTVGGFLRKHSCFHSSTTAIFYVSKEGPLVIFSPPSPELLLVVFTYPWVHDQLRYIKVVPRCTYTIVTWVCGVF